MAFLVSLSVMGIAVWLVERGYAVAGAGLVGTTIVGLASVFVGGRWIEAKERIEKSDNRDRVLRPRGPG